MERRIHPRVVVTHPVLYFSDVLSGPRHATTVDLSMGGTKIETSYGLQEGEGIEISIAIQSRVIRCRGHVVYTESRIGDRLKAGVQFKEISKEDGLYLGEYISSVVDRRDQTIFGRIGSSLSG